MSRLIRTALRVELQHSDKYPGPPSRTCRARRGGIKVAAVEVADHWVRLLLFARFAATWLFQELGSP